VARVGIGLGVNGNGADAHTTCRPDNATGDLAAVGNQNLGKHRAPFQLCSASLQCWKRPRFQARQVVHSSPPNIRRAGVLFPGSQPFQSAIQLGCRLSRKAARPSLPSGLARTRVIRCAVSAIVCLVDRLASNDANQRLALGLSLRAVGQQAVEDLRNRFVELFLAREQARAADRCDRPRPPRNARQSACSDGNSARRSPPAHTD
jgi:hypothetical protein